MNTNRIQIVLVEPSHPGNIGAAARAAKTMGIEHMTLVNPESFPSPKATARATSAADVLERAQVCKSLGDAISDSTLVVATTARARGLTCPQIPIRELGTKVWQEVQHGNVSIVFGRESNGLSNQEMDLCQFFTCIPTNWEFSALNLAAAVQVICYELFISRLPENSNENLGVADYATSSELEGYFQHLQEVLLEIEFLDPKQPKLLMRRLRHLYHRARLTTLEINILRGVLSCTQRMVGLNKK